jgi:AGZA family xanthine/uracil permease-like MFS transporter
MQNVRSKLPWLVRGDIDGFFGLGLDNLVQLLVLTGLCRFVLDFPDALILGRIVPGAAVSLLVGNFYYAWAARRLAQRESRSDVCALPYGINTVSLFAFVFLVMLPAKLAAQAAGDSDPATAAWHAGLLACFGAALIELTGSLFADRIRRITPRAALLSTLAGIALSFIALGFLFRAYAHPLVGITTLVIVLIGYFGGVRFRGGLPTGLISIVIGAALCWLTGLAPAGAAPAAPHLSLPVPVLGELFASLQPQLAVDYLSVIVPMGLFNLIGSMQNLESAEAAGDAFDTRSSLVVNGIGSLAACAFGSCFPTTIYIGHPGWKFMGARAGYSALSGMVMAALCFSGTLAAVAWAIPVDAGMAILLWIGIVIAAQAFTATPRSHAPASVIGVMVGVGCWGAFMAKAGLHAAGAGVPGGAPFSTDLLAGFHASDVWIEGAFALEQGAIFSAMILAAATVYIIERHFLRAAAWLFAGAALSLLGLMHSYRLTTADSVLSLTPALPFAAAYAIAGVIAAAARWLTVPIGESETRSETAAQTRR